MSEMSVVLQTLSDCDDELISRFAAGSDIHELSVRPLSMVGVEDAMASRVQGGGPT